MVKPLLPLATHSQGLWDVRDFAFLFLFALGWGDLVTACHSDGSRDDKTQSSMWSGISRWRRRVA